MHICLISHEFPKPGVPHGGIGTFLKFYSQLLVSKGHRVSVIGVIATAKRSVQDVNGVHIIEAAFKPKKGLTWIIKARILNSELEQLHKQHPIDILEGQERAFALVKKIPAIKHVVRLHGGHHFFAEGENRKVDTWKGFLEKRSFAKADAFIAVSDYVKSHTAKFLSYHNKPITTINYPIDFSQFYKADADKVKPNTLVFAGTVCEKKGIRQLMMALPLIAEKFPEISLDVYGRDWLFPNRSSYIEWLKKQFSSDELKRVRFHGAIAHKELPKAYEAAEICVFPSHMETQGLVAPEAMAMQKPVIFTTLGPGPETIEPGVTGWLCNPLDPKDIAAKVITALESRAQHQKIGQNARTFALNKFDAERIVEENLKFYSSLPG